ncbi:RNA-directed DNA polymerase from mobile element jockey [Eumeta japonica]|uniref:RNA-directed DNA polymerase from mobile element jockey n=1 Tax=Eumeta variegata TaxID=151549 RepID=A0A4C1Z6G1_EUMVA|nr:RNA-directed DNA polymerase from mobile element jockey [Eumeta japonica]
MEEITPSHQAFWKLSKALKSERLELQCSHILPPNDSHHITRIEEEVGQKTSLKPRDVLSPFSLNEVQKPVKYLKVKKAPGLDGIIKKAIKCFFLTLLSLLVAIFNACLKNCYFFPVWKEAEVIGIPKTGKSQDLPASYKPISLLSGLGVQLALFADDTALYLCGPTERNICPHLQRAMDELARWFQTWRVEVNPKKSAAISFIYKKGRSSVEVARGVTLDRSLHFRDHIKRVRRTAIFYLTRLNGVLVTSCPERIPLKDPPQGKSRAVNTLVCCPAASGEAEYSPS